MKKLSADQLQILVKEVYSGLNPDSLFSREAAKNAVRFHKSLPAYQSTQLKSLTAAAAKYGVGAIFVKDESSRFGLKAFKGLGGSYAVFRSLCERFGMDPLSAAYCDFQAPEVREKCKDLTFVTATDGNHGKGVAWAASLFGCRSYVLMPKGTVEVRRQAIEDAGASAAVITDGNYDQAVAFAARLAEEKGWILVQDTSWEGYEDVPRWIVEGYLTMAEEACEQMHGRVPTHVFLQAGVGAMAGGIAGYFLNRYPDCPPKITLAEPETVACVLLSAEADDGESHSVEGDPVTVMAGLNCGTPCGITWPVLRDGVSFYCACSDRITEEGMRAYADPPGGDPAVVSGESGAVTYGLLRRILQDQELRKLWGMDENSVILLISTEGDTDPENYARVVRQS